VGEKRQSVEPKSLPRQRFFGQKPTSQIPKSAKGQKGERDTFLVKKRSITDGISQEWKALRDIPGVKKSGKNKKRKGG